MRYPSEASMKCGRNSTTEKLGSYSKFSVTCSWRAKLHATIGVTVFLLDSLFPAGYGYEREQARGGLLHKAMQMPVQAEG